MFYLDYQEPRFAETSLCGITHKSWLRFQVVKLTTRSLFNNFILVVIFANSIMMGAKDYMDPDNLTKRNQLIGMIDPYINAIVYTECVLKIFAMGFVFGRNSYLRDGWNVLDFLVVFTSVITEV